MSMNKAFVMGRLTADPELRYTQSGVAVATFRLAVTRDFKDKDGERKADFFNVVCWRATAEFVSKWISKGNMIVVVGRLQNRDYTDKDGNKRTVTEIISENVYPAESRKKDDTEQTYPSGGEQFGDISDSEDLPF